MREMSSAMTISASRVSSLIDMDDDESISKMLRKENPLYGGIIPPFVRCAPRARFLPKCNRPRGRACENKEGTVQDFENFFYAILIRRP